MALTGFTDICESFPPFQIKSSRWDESKLKIQRTFLEVFPPDTVLLSVSPPRVILLIFFFLHISLVSFRWSEHFQQSFPKKNKTNIYSFYIKSAQKTKKKIKHLHCQQEFEHNAVILTLHRDVNQFREFRWRSRLVNRLTVTNTKTGGCSDYQLHCKKQSHHSSLEFWGGMVSPGKHAYTEWEPPPPTASNHTLLLLRSVCKNKKGSKSRRSNWGGAAAEAQNTERRLGRISEVDICSFSPLQVASGERRHHRMSTWTNQVAPFLIEMVKPIS